MIREPKVQPADPYDRLFRVPKWNRLIRVTDDHGLFRRLPEFATWTRARHLDAAREYLDRHLITARAYRRAVDSAIALYGDRGPLIAGVVRDHFPEQVKDHLRQLAHGTSRQADISIAHWRASRRTTDAWRTLRDRIVAA